MDDDRGEESLSDDVDAAGGVDGDVFEVGVEGYGERGGDGPGVVVQMMV